MLTNRLIEDCEKVKHQLVNWLQEAYASSRPGSYAENGMISAVSDINDLNTVYLMNLCWTACILINSTLQLAGSSNALASDQLPRPSYTDPRTYCRKIIDSVMKFLTASSSPLPTHCLVFPLGMAFAYLQATDTGARSLEMQQLLDFFNSGEKGMRIRRFFYSMLRSGPASVIDLQDEEIEGPVSEWRFFRAKTRAWFGMTIEGDEGYDRVKSVTVSIY